MTNNIFKEAKSLQKVAFSPVRKVMDEMRVFIDQGKDVIPFQIGQPDFFTPDLIIEETKIALDKRLTHYAPNRGVLKLRQAVAEELKKKGLTYNPEDEILITVGGAEAIFDGLFGFLNEGDEVIVPTPSFMNYENVINMAGGIYVELPLKYENGFQIDIVELEKAITPKTKMIILNNPSNPTGVVFSEDVLGKVAKIAIKHNLIVFTDEIYDQILYDNVVCKSIATFEGMRERTIVMNGFSKSHAMTGWRMGYVAAPANAINAMLKVHQYTVTCVSTFSQEGLAVALLKEETEKEKQAMVDIFAQRRLLLLELLKNVPKVSFIAPEGAFYIFLNIGETKLSGEEFSSRLLREKYVAVVPGSGFSRDARDFVRLSFATSEENIKEGIKRMADFINSL